MAITAEQIRILSNYARMAITVVMGLWLVRIFTGISQDVFTVVALVATSTGMAGMLKEMVRGTMVPELGLALHGKSEVEFEEVFSSAFFLSFVAALFSVAVLSVVLFFLDRFSIPADLFAAAVTLVLTRMASTFVAVLVAPATNLLPVTGNNGLHNIYQTLERLGELCAALAAVSLASGAGAIVEIFAWLSFAAIIAVNMAWAWHGVRISRQKWPRPTMVSLPEVWKMAATVGWNGFVVLAFNFYMRFDLLFVSWYFGLAGAFAFAIASQLLNYMRQLTIGLVQGMDAAIARQVAVERVVTPKTRKFIATTGTMQALVILSAAGFLAVNASAVMALWLGPGFVAGSATASQMVMLFLVMIPGMVARGLSEGWMKVLSGIGEVRAYGPLLLIGSLFNPLAVYALSKWLPADISYLGVAIAFSALMIVSHAVALPLKTSRTLKVPLSELLRPFARPALLAIAATAVSWLVHRYLPWHSAIELLLSAAIFAVAMGIPFARALLRMGRQEKEN